MTGDTVTQPAGPQLANAPAPCQLGRGGSTYEPTFAELQRCDWGAHVTVHGEAARFNNAGWMDDERIVVVLADRCNRVLAEKALGFQAASELENAYYCLYEGAGLRMGISPAAPMLPEQAAACLRAGDLVMVNGVPATYGGMELCDDDLLLMLRVAPGARQPFRSSGPSPLEGDGAATWSLKWRPGLQVRLVSARLPTFDELREMPAGTPVTLGSHAIPAKLFCTMVRDGTRHFVLVQARRDLKLREAETQPSNRKGEWIYRVRYEEAGIRVAESNQTAV